MPRDLFITSREGLDNFDRPAQDPTDDPRIRSALMILEMAHSGHFVFEVFCPNF